MRYLFIFLFSLESMSSWAQSARYQLDGQDIMVPALSSREILTEHSRFNDFIRSFFNRPGSFHGPNCYNTALLATGVFAKDKVRYVSPQEFEAILESHFQIISSPEYKDLIVFDAKGSRGHAAYYLGDNLIFHKKSYSTNYHYRIVEIENAGAVESKEWVPGPMDDSSTQMNWPELGRLPKMYYRVQSSSPPDYDPRFREILIMLEKKLINDLRTWAIGKKWGMMGEHLIEDLLKYSHKLKVNRYTQGLIISLQDQIYIMMEEVYFRRARNPSRVLEQVCLPEESQQFNEIIRYIGQWLGKEKDKIEVVIEKMSKQDKALCNFRPLDELLKF